jgi:hypothetical protein
MLCKVLLIFFFLGHARSRPHGRTEKLAGSWPQAMPWPVPWYMQGIMLGGRPDDIQEDTDEISEIMAKEPENPVQENQEEKLAQIILVQASLDLHNKWTRIQKRGRKSGPMNPRFRILKVKINRA